MHIALFYNVPSGGAKRAIYEWTRRLTLRHAIDVYTLSTADHTFCDISPITQQYRVIDFNPHKLFDSPFGRLNQLQRWTDLGDLNKVGRYIALDINKGNYDVVFANTCRFTFIPAFLQFIQIPSAYYVHEPFGKNFSRDVKRPYTNNNRWRQALDKIDPFIKLYESRLKSIQIKSINQTGQFISNSNFTKKKMMQIFGIDTLTCYLGVDCERFHPIPGECKEDFVISVGELSPRKGFDFIIESLGNIPPDKRPKLKLACNTVDPSERDYIKSLAAQYGVDLQVLINISTHELAVQYNKAQLCVYAPVLEPFGLVPLESMSCGTPVVAVSEGGVKESIIHEYTGLLVERDPAQFADAIQLLLSNPKLALEFGRNGREQVINQWTWDKSAALLENHLLACAEGRSCLRSQQ